MNKKDDENRIIDIFAGGDGQREITKGADWTKSFFSFCCRHSRYVSLVRPHKVTYTLTQQMKGLQNKMDSAVSRMIKKYNTNEDGYADELRRTHSIENKTQFDAYIERIRKDNYDTLRQMDSGELPAKEQDVFNGLRELGMIERKIVEYGGPIVEKCFFPIAAVQKYIESATDIFQFPIMIGEFEFEDWTFYKEDSALEDNTFASATSHERIARLWLTIGEYEEFHVIGLPDSILHKVYPPTSGQNAVKW